MSDLARNKTDKHGRVGVFLKTIILLRLAGYKMTITNSALRPSSVIYHIRHILHALVE